MEGIEAQLHMLCEDDRLIMIREDRASKKAIFGLRVIFRAVTAPDTGEGLACDEIPNETNIDAIVMKVSRLKEIPRIFREPDVVGFRPR